MYYLWQDEAAKSEHDMEERHAQELAALEQRKKEAAGPDEDKTSILNTDLYSFSLPPAETQKNVSLVSLFDSNPQWFDTYQICLAYG